MVILATKQEVYHEHGDSGASNDHKSVAEEQEAEHVVDLAEPDRGHDEVEFDENGAEGEDADQEHGWDGAHVGGARWNLARNLVGADWGCDGLLSKSDPATSEGEGHGDQEPDSNDD